VPKTDERSELKNGGQKNGWGKKKRRTGTIVEKIKKKTPKQ